jgi:hypothetical protein
MKILNCRYKSVFLYLNNQFRILKKNCFFYEFQSFNVIINLFLAIILIWVFPFVMSIVNQEDWYAMVMIVEQIEWYANNAILNTTNTIKSTLSKNM